METIGGPKRQKILELIRNEEKSDYFGKAAFISLGVNTLIGLAALATCYFISPEMEVERIIKPATYFAAAFGGGAASTITLGMVSERFHKKAKELRENIINKTRLVPLKKGPNTAESFRERAEAKLERDIEIIEGEIGFNDDFEDNEPWEVEEDVRSKK